MRSFSAIQACVFLALVAIFVWSGEILDHKWMNHDVANALYVGERLVEGDRLYVDWYYFVMPPVVFLSSAACLVARAVGLSPPTVLHLFLVFSGLLGWIVIRGLGDSRSLRLAGLCLAYLAILVHAGLHPADFAQREHFFALLFVPYFLWRIGRGAWSPPVYLLLVSLGYASMVKPHFVVAVLATELFCLREQDRRLRTWGLLLLGVLLPFVALALHSTQSLGAFFNEAVAYHLSGSYDGFSRPIGRFLSGEANRKLVALGAALLASGAYCTFRRVASARVVAASCALAVVFYLSILHQQKFFPYHQIPFVAFAFVSAAGLLGTAADAMVSKRARWLAGAVVLLIPTLAIGQGFDSLVEMTKAWPNRHTRPLLPMLRGQSLILLMSPAVEGGIFSYAFSHELEIMGPWSSNYTVSSILDIDDRAARVRSLKEYFEPIARKLGVEKPGLVVFSPFGFGGPTMHEVFVDRFELFPTPEYRFWKRTRNGWVVYRRVAGRS